MRTMHWTHHRTSRMMGSSTDDDKESTRMSAATLTESPADSAPTPSFDLQAITPNIGAEVSAIDLGDELDDDTIAELRAALVRHMVLVFRDQPLTPAAHVALARR